MDNAGYKKFPLENPRLTFRVLLLVDDWSIGESSPLRQAA
jgi:hypothetical protein